MPLQMYSKIVQESNDTLSISRSIKPASNTITKFFIFNFFINFFSQINVFTNSTKFLIDGVVNGFNATVFAYGPTGAGKTYTYN